MIASLSLGAKARFQLRKMTNVWPTKDTPKGGVETGVAMHEFLLDGGDLLVMRGKTQDGWHHRVPKDRQRAPRVNINFRYILPNRDDSSLTGVRKFYKYMVSGDAKTQGWEVTAPSFSYEALLQLQRKKQPMRTFLLSHSSSSSFSSLSSSSTSSTSSSSSSSSSSSLLTQFATIEAADGFDEAAASNISSGPAEGGEKEKEEKEEAKEEEEVEDKKEKEVERAHALSCAPFSWVCQTCTYENIAFPTAPLSVPAPLPLPASASNSINTCQLCDTRRVKIPKSSPCSKNKVKGVSIKSFFISSSNKK